MPRELSRHNSYYANIYEHEPAMRLKYALIPACLLAAGWALQATAADQLRANTSASKWDSAFAEFAEADRAHPQPEGGVLFVGSSSIRLWSDLEEQFKAVPVVKRGFGGSQLSDCVEHLNRLVVQYRPRMVLVYAGDNDLAAGSTPEEVTRRFVAFAEGVHRDLPDTQVTYISIKPSPSRSALLAKIQEANAMIREYADEQPNVAFIDVHTPMLDAGGQPRSDLFLADALHLNSAGYAVWKQAIAPHVR